MRISFLHLSDFHLNDSKGVHPAKIQAIVDSLGVYTPIEGIVIVLSGDIAATGQANQYKIVATFLKRLIPEIRRKYSISEKNTKILIVPGNHDIDWGRSTRLDSSKIRSFDEKERALHLQQELKSMKNYFSFSDRNGCFFPYWMHIPFGQLVTRKILHFDNGYRIEANLLNTAPLDIYDYDETKIDELNNQLIRAFLQLKIIARNFSAFISILPGPVKKDYVSAMYQLPNKIFSQWAESIDNSLDYLVEEVIAWQEEPDFEGKKLSREDILRFFQEVSLNMLLNLYYVASSHGANDNTVDYLAQQNYISPSLNYRIERLMFWEKVDDYQAVIKEAEELCSLQGDGMAKNMTLAILRHMLVHSDKIIDRERRRISSKYFSPRTQAKILMDRQKSQKERGI